MKLVIATVLLLASFLHAQSYQSAVFNRKSITILPATSSKSESYYSTVKSQMRNIESSSRFDYNKISSQSQDAFENKISKNDKVFSNEYDLKSILAESGVLQEIIRSTSNLDTIQSRHNRSLKRLHTSAAEQQKINKPTIKELMTLLNGTFIGVVRLDSIKGTRSNSDAYGSLVWLKLDFNNVTNWDNDVPSYDQVKVKIVRQEQVKQSGSESKTESGAVITAEQNAIATLNDKIMKLAMDMEEFKLRATVQDITSGIRMDIGKREDVYLDQGYKLYEQRMDQNNQVYSKYMGFVRIAEVGDNTTKIDALSNAYKILGSYDQGYTAVSHDQLFDLVIRPSYQLVSIPKEVGSIVGTPFSSDATTAYNIEAAALYNMAKAFNTRQLFVGLAVKASFYNITPQSSGANITLPYGLNYSLILQKKFWLAPVALTFEVSGGYQTFNMTSKFGSVEETLSLNSYSASGGIGLQIAASADVLFGFNAGYSYVLEPTSLKIKDINNNEKEYSSSSLVWQLYKIDKMQLGGLYGGINFSYSFSMFGK
jgi:hypothetical protein